MNAPRHNWLGILELAGWAAIVLGLVGYSFYLSSMPLPPKPAPAVKLGDCRPPAEFEHLHIVVTRRAAGALAVDCMYVGAPTFYRAPQPKAD